MFITRESDYAMRVIRALMWEPRLSVSEICERESITAPFAYKILKKLQNAGLVEGYRGVHGGYALKRDPEELSLYEIYSAIDPDMSIIECLNGTYQCPRNGQDGVPCHAHDELKEIQDQLWTMLRRKSMKDLFGKEEKLFPNVSCDKRMR